MWYNKYIGIPYKDKGRDEAGVDCWGLVALVYKNEFGIELPSFTDTYSSADDSDSVEYAISHNKDSWQAVEVGTIGSVVLFRVLGTLSHVGIYIGNNQFIHARSEGIEVVIENLDSGSWKHRFAGFYEYSENLGTANLTAIPHPLQAKSFNENIPAGSTLQEIHNRVVALHNINSEVPTKYIMFLNGEPVSQGLWATTKIKDGDKVDYRILADKGDGLRMLLMIAVMVVANMYAPGLGAGLAEAATAASVEAGTMGLLGETIVSSTAVAGWTAAANIGIQVVGSLIINAIAPIRPKENNDPGTPNALNLFSGGSNQIAKYAPIPVVLGKLRITPPAAAQQIVEYPNSDATRLNSIVAWGFGPLSVTDIQIGANPLSNYSDYKIHTLYGWPNENTTNFDRIYSRDAQQLVPNTKLINATEYNPDELTGDAINPWYEYTLTQNSDRLEIALHFPEGLRRIQTKGEGAGSVSHAEFRASIQYQRLNDNLEPYNDWGDFNIVQASRFNVPKSAYIGEIQDGDVYYYTYTPLYTWTVVYINKYGSIEHIIGAGSPTKNGSALVGYDGSRYSTQVGINASSPPIPVAPAGSKLLYAVCMYEYAVDQIIDYRSSSFASYTGLNLTVADSYATVELGEGTGEVLAGKYLNITSGQYTMSGAVGAIAIGGVDEAYAQRKDAFTYISSFNVPPGKYRIRVKRTNPDTVDLPPGSSEPEARNYHQAIVYSVTGYNSASPPTVNPRGCYVAKTALSILSTNNVNGRLDGINGIVQTICLAWRRSNPSDFNTGGWTEMIPTSNPASLFLYVLTHPANMFRIAGLDSSRINLVELGSWYEYCQEMGFEYNGIVDSQKSVLDTLKDIASAGRASPTLLDGKWSVVIDRPRTAIKQMFTPHNSWGFEGVKALPRVPDAFRVVFRNQDKAYQDDEVCVYNQGYNETTAAIIEEISLPGITSRSQAINHAAWHLAQIKLRPEVYSISTDFEYLVCTRGDLVRVAHDVPLWGTATGRVKNKISSTVLELDEPVYLQEGLSYVIRLRNENASITGQKQIATITETGTYTTITLTAPLSESEGTFNSLFIIGENNRESQELIVLGIEPASNLTAKITLVDYSPELYDLDLNQNVYVPPYNPNITLIPEKLINTVKQIPQIVAANIVSDESVLTTTASGALISNIRVPYNNPNDLPVSVTHIEVQYDLNSSTSNDNWQFSEVIPIKTGSVTISDVQDTVAYKIRARYVTDVGTIGPWSSTLVHTVIGKTTPPATVTGFVTPTLNQTSLTLTLNWSASPERDIGGYEVYAEPARRTAGVLATSPLATSQLVFKGDAITCSVKIPPASVETAYYIRAYDVVGNVSASWAYVAYTLPAPAVPSGLGYGYGLSKTTTTAIFSWSAGLPAVGSLPIAEYVLELSYINPIATTKTFRVSSTTVETEVQWKDVVGNDDSATIRVRAVDTAGNTSSWTSEVIVEKKRPQQVPGTPVVLVEGTSLAVSWATPPTPLGYLPISNYEIRVDGSDTANWGFASGLLWSGNANSASISLLGKTSGTYTWYIRGFDTTGDYSATSTAIAYTLDKPPMPNSPSISFQDTSLTSATVTISWNAVSPVFGLNGYELEYRSSTSPETWSPVAFTKSNTITLPANWGVGVRVFRIRTQDNLLANYSDWRQFEIVIQKPNPINVNTFTAQVIDNTVLLYWELPAISTLPISHVLIRKGPQWDTGYTPIGEKSGTFTTVTENAAGEYTYWIATVDTEGNESDPVSITRKVSQPPNYQFFAEHVSTLETKLGPPGQPNISTVTLTNAKKDPNRQIVVLPVNLTETFQQHFQTGAGSGSWSSPQDQVSAGFDFVLQPGLTTGVYQEIIDFETLIGSSQVTLTLDYAQLDGGAGDLDVKTYLSYSADDITWSAESASSNIFATGFRYIKVRVVVEQKTAARALFSIHGLVVKLDNKQISESGKVTALKADTNGTIVNFTKEFVDIASVVLTGASTTACIPVYDFKDDVIQATYTVTSGIATITTATDHGLETGQAVRLAFISGGGVTGVYIITKVNATVYTVSMPVANTSGGVSTYANSMRVYAFDTSGQRVDPSVIVSWSITGY